MVIFESCKFIYIHIHKTGGETVESTLLQARVSGDAILGAEYLGADDDSARLTNLNKHSTACEVMQTIGFDAWKSYLSWATVRSPYSRIVSLYGSMASVTEPDLPFIGFPTNGSAEAQRQWVDSAEYPRDDAPWTFAGVRAYLATRGSKTPFSDFLRHPLLHTDEPAFCSQYSRLSDADGRKLLVSKFVQLETLASSWRGLCSELGLPTMPLVLKNITPERWKFTVNELFSRPSDVAFLNRTHREDFRVFGYEMMGADPSQKVYTSKPAAPEPASTAPEQPALPAPSVAVADDSAGTERAIHDLLSSTEGAYFTLKAPSFSFRARPISDSELYTDILSEKTRRSIAPSPWVLNCSDPSPGRPEVYVCEAFGGASPEELTTLIAAVESKGAFVLLVWTDDWAFALPAGSRSLVFDVSAPAPLTCTYGWNARKYGPDRISSWKPFAQRKYLASFVGSRSTHKVRDILFDEAITGRPDMVIEDIDWWGRQGDTQAERSRLEARFGDVLSESKFAFCPRGNGPSSKRRWESAYCGAIPVLMDDLMSPFGLMSQSLEFTSSNFTSDSGDATRLLALISGKVDEGPRLQAQMKETLLSQLDAPILSSAHTTVRQIIGVANKYWTETGGFLPPAT